MAGTGSTSLGGAQIRKLLASRNIERVVVLGANGTMGFGSGALFTQAVPHVTFLARSRAKAASAESASRSPSHSRREMAETHSTGVPHHAINPPSTSRSASRRWLAGSATRRGTMAELSQNFNGRPPAPR